MRCGYRDASFYRKCEGCGKNDVLKPKRKCASCKSTKGMKVVQLRDGNKGRRAVGTSLTRPNDVSRTKTKRYRESFPPRELTAYHYDHGR